jgi:DNA polymerase-2
MEAEGWLLDIYPLRDRMILWIRTLKGGSLRLEDPFVFSIHASGKRKALQRLGQRALARGFVTGYSWETKREFWSGQEIEVLALRVSDYDRLPRLRSLLFSWEDSISFFNCDIPLSQYYLYSRGIFPLGRCGVEFEGEQLQRIHPLESPWEPEYALPDLAILELSCDGSPLLPGRRGSSLLLRCDGRSWVLDSVPPTEMLQQINRILRHQDPDLVLTDHGDSFLLPSLLRLSRRWRIPLSFDREPVPIRRALVTEGRSYFTYGKIIYNGPDYPFFGRLHVDRHNSFFYQATGWEGIAEISRLSKIPVQRLARRSAGTAISSMQLDRAFQEGILIPWHKGEPERFKTAWDLLVTDKGGLIFQPALGLHEGVAEIDFSSMYPTIMVQHNISGETLLCSCCPEPQVPESGYNICQRREGLVPKVLAPLLARRRAFKERMKQVEGAEKELYCRRQTALKWLLVVCFGYLGYRNSRFGRIEAHEAVTAYGREKLLLAKEISEARGFRVLHALTDALWIVKPGMCRSELLELCAEIQKATGVPIELEGIYNWIAFLPSKVKGDLPVATRYFGALEEGEIKVRGLACRRSDTPPLIQEAQQRILQLLSTCKDSQEYRQRNQEAREILEDYLLRLHQGEVRKEDLLITKTVRQRPSEYKVATPTALALRQLEEVGIELHPGEKIQYLIKDGRAKVKEERVRASLLLGPDDLYDEGKYRELLLEAAEEVLEAPQYPLSGACSHPLSK